MNIGGTLFSVLHHIHDRYVEPQRVKEGPGGRFLHSGQPPTLVWEMTFSQSSSPSWEECPWAVAGGKALGRARPGHPEALGFFQLAPSCHLQTGH